MRLLTMALATTLLSTAAQAADLSGRATVVDGDTLQIEGVKERIRLYGVDAPESKQTCDDARGKRYLCGSRSAEALAEIIGRQGRVQCFEEDRDRYGRIVAECATAGNTVVNAEMVRQGWAVEYDDYSDGRYDQEEREAKKAKRGIWAGRFVKPSAWRRGERLASEQAATVEEQGAPSTKCLIKGNISGSGKIYHTPSSRSYEKTVIDEADGERWFCTETEAKAAGWRAPRG
ncbi:thermonuclease family protein [Antarcticirhabdus aurantiaca]|uniref:Thermonuclease family protein n=1 Tax=Antarcticirhabdus aurantiaca TaxID=2606717 RepID=A0ACD4NW13_9HYPH|nr:thermonuclease family protein [Antarcticirhabdus aurantiaca]WAJ31186.1 thermonuclease family protein [Jeongeuplla avenae]